MLDAGKLMIDWTEFEPVPEARHGVCVCAINVSCSGHVSLNSRLLAELKAREVPLKLGFYWRKQDKNVLLLRQTDSPNYSFPSAGSKKDLGFTRALVAAGIPLPARYVVAWNEDAGAWVGVRNDSRADDPLEVLAKTNGRRKRA